MVQVRRGIVFVGLLLVFLIGLASGARARVVINGTPWNPNPEAPDGTCLLTGLSKVPDSYCQRAGLSKPADECVQNPWIFYYNAECVGQPQGDRCTYEYGWHQKVCSTADTCVAGEKGLRPGICDASKGGCVVGESIYKTCCDGTTPVNCQGGVHTGTCGSATAQFCGFDSYPACGEAACASNTGGSGGGGGGSPTPTQPPPPSPGCNETGEPTWLAYPSYTQGGIVMVWWEVSSSACGWCSDADGYGVFRSPVNDISTSNREEFLNSDMV